jgi:hypothetical protein
MLFEGQALAPGLQHRYDSNIPICLLCGDILFFIPPENRTKDIEILYAGKNTER